MYFKRAGESSELSRASAKKEAKAKIDSMQAAWAKHQAEVWAKCEPIVKKEHAEGRPYVPWAGRPTDLPQAKIPAFPGAEGGGMYSFGGRGGKVVFTPGDYVTGSIFLKNGVELELQEGATILGGFRWL